jgi:hypothetical protein
MALVAVVGSRALPRSFAPAVSRACRLLDGAGRRVCTGCAKGADAFAREAGVRVDLFSAASRKPADLRARTAGLVRAVAASGPGAGVVCFFWGPRSPGSVLTCRLALEAGLPVLGFDANGWLPRLGDGEWVPAASAGFWSLFRRWVPAPDA